MALSSGQGPGLAMPPRGPRLGELGHGGFDPVVHRGRPARLGLRHASGPDGCGKSGVGPLLGHYSRMDSKAGKEIIDLIKVARQLMQP